MPAEERKRHLGEPIEAMTDATTVEPAEMERELDGPRRGYAASKGQRTVGIYAVASPVFDHTQRVIGAIGVSVPEVRMARSGPNHWYPGA